jgi:dipeptidyl-peptidase III
MASISPEASASLEKISDLMVSTQPSNLWYPSETSQSSYYLGTTSITKEEIGAVTKVMEVKKIAPENTRLLKRSTASFPTVEKPVIYEVLQTSAEEDAAP